MASTTRIFDLSDERQTEDLRTRLRLGSNDGDRKVEKALEAARGKRRRAGTSAGGPAPSASASGIHPLPDVSYVWR